MGWLYCVVTIFSIIGLIGLNYNMIGQKILRSYWFYLIIGITFLIYFVIIRFLPYWQQFSLAYNAMHDRDRSMILSKSLFLDLCPFCAFIMPLLYIFDYKKKIIKIIAPWSMFGALITIFGEITFSDMPFNAHYIFVGDEYMEVYFMIHYISLMMSLTILITSEKYNIDTIIISFVFIVLYLIYVVSVGESIGVDEWRTGTCAKDWMYDGEYSVVGQIINLPFPWVMIIGYLGAVVSVILIIFVNNFLHQYYPKLVFKNNFNFIRWNKYFEKFYE